jgi:hypothetical protein
MNDPKIDNLRDFFAGHALTVVAMVRPPGSAADMATHSYEVADAMLAEREKPPAVIVSVDMLRLWRRLLQTDPEELARRMDARISA